MTNTGIQIQIYKYRYMPLILVPFYASVILILLLHGLTNIKKIQVED